MMWEKVRLVDICRPKQWKTLSTNNLLDRGYPVYGANGKIGFYNKYTHESPTLIITCRGATCGSLHITDPKSYVNGNAMALDSIRKDVDIKFLYYYFSERGFQDIISGSAQPQITGKGLSKITIPLPPLPIQKRIAEILDTADALRRKDEALLKKYEELAQAIFIDMFGDPVKNEKGWEVKKFEDCIEYIGDIGSNGSNDTISKNLEMSDAEGYAIMIRTTNLNANNFENNLKYVSKKTYDFFSKSQIFGGEIIMNKIGSAGDFWIMPNLNKPVSLGLNQLVIRLKNLDTKYLYYYLSTNYGKAVIKSSINGAVTKSITKSAVKELPLLYPKLELQNKFAEIINLIEKQKEVSKAKKTINLFNSLLQKAFNGELVA